MLRFFALALALALTCASDAVPIEPTKDWPLGLSFGEKGAGAPHSPKAGEIVAYGKLAGDPKAFDGIKVVLERETGVRTYKRHEAEMGKDGWRVSVTGLPAGTYRIRLSLEARHRDTNAAGLVFHPDMTSKPPYIEVVVK